MYWGTPRWAQCIFGLYNTYVSHLLLLGNFLGLVLLLSLRRDPQVRNNLVQMIVAYMNRAKELLYVVHMERDTNPAPANLISNALLFSRGAP